MTTYSCTMFFNEFDLLDLRIAEELGVIDKLLITEANKTHQNKKKPLHLKDNLKYKHPKIQISFIEDKFGNKAWTNEKMQRNYLPIAYKDDDVFIVCDLDEINKKEDIPNIIETAREKGLVRIGQRMYLYKINLLSSAHNWWKRSFAVTGKYLRESNKTLSDLRTNKEGYMLRTNGRHFSYLGDSKDVIYKIKSFAHRKYNTSKNTNIKTINDRIKNLQDPFGRDRRELQIVEIDDTYPKTILSNLDYWKKHIWEKK